MKKLIAGMGSALLIALAVAVVWPTTAGASAVLQSEGSGSAAAAGQKIFMDQKCNLCHDVSTAGIAATTKSEKMKGPDLKGVSKDKDTLAKFLKKEVDLNGKKHTKGFTGSDAELSALLDWVLEQK